MMGRYDLMRTYQKDTPGVPDLDLWFEDGYDDEATAQKALSRVGAFLATHGAALHESPTMAGRELLHRMLPKDLRWPQLADATQAQIRHSFTQACVQHVPSVAMVQNIYQYDARFAYAGCLRNLPCAMSGEVIHDASSQYEGFRKAFYEVELTVPRGWRHVGLVPRRPAKHSQYWDFPNQPGETWRTWLDACEVDLLLSGMGTRKEPIMPWPHVIRQRMLFDDEKVTPGCDPLKNWIETIKPLVEKLDAPADEEHRLIRAALRAMVLNTIGGFRARGMLTCTHVARGQPMPLEVPQNAEIDRQDDGSIDYYWYGPYTGMLAQWNHPEWAAHVWALQRSRTIKKALALPYDTVINLYTDAIYTTAPTGWQDDGKTGTFRLKDELHLPEAQWMPTSGAALKRMMGHE